MNALRQDTMDDVRAFRAMRPQVRCTCSLGPDPDCAVDHTGAAGDIRTAADRKTASADWCARNVFELDALTDPTLWALLIAKDDIAFGERMRKLLETLADEHAKFEHEQAEAAL